jgi:uncharacterized membrane protein YbaN (DUF454 family)
MIQRVQSVWLFLAGLTLFLLLILPVLSLPSGTAETWMQVGGIFQKTGNTIQKTESFNLLFGVTILAGIVCLAAIFLFKNRTLQKRIIMLSIFLILMVIVLAANYAMSIAAGPAAAKLQTGAGLPVLALIFCALGFRGIRKDEQLIRSADRLR